MAPRSLIVVSNRGPISYVREEGERVARRGAGGLVTALAFVIFGLSRVLPHGMTASLGARILFIPGATALWPYVLIRWLQAQSAR